MEITKVYLAARPDELKTDVTELETFLFRINNCYVSRGHYFTPVLSDNMSDGTTGGNEIAECALAFFLTGPGESVSFSEGSRLQAARVYRMHTIQRSTASAKQVSQRFLCTRKA